MENEIQTQQQTNKSVHLAVAIVGWVAFLATLIYGVAVYGPQQYNKGILDNAEYVDTVVETAISTEDNLDPLGNTPAEIVYGSVKNVEADSIVVSISDLRLGGDKDLTFYLSPDISIVRTSVPGSTSTDEDGNLVQTGESQELPINIDSLNRDQQILLHYVTDDSGELTAIKIEAY